MLTNNVVYRVHSVPNNILHCMYTYKCTKRTFCCTHNLPISSFTLNQQNSIWWIFFLRITCALYALRVHDARFANFTLLAGFSPEGGVRGAGEIHDPPPGCKYHRELSDAGREREGGGDTLQLTSQISNSGHPHSHTH